MLELQVPLLAAKALLLLLLFAFVYAVVRRGIGDLRNVPDEGDIASSGGSAVAGGRKRSARQPELRVESSGVLTEGSRHVLTGDSMSVGRSQDGDIVLKGDEFASSRHAAFTRNAGLIYVEDTGSTNGTFVNGNRVVGATPLRDGDEVRVGSTTFRFAG